MTGLDRRDIVTAELLGLDETAPHERAMPEEPPAPELLIHVPPPPSGPPPRHTASERDLPRETLQMIHEINQSMPSLSSSPAALPESSSLECDIYNIAGYSRRSRKLSCEICNGSGQIVVFTDSLGQPGYKGCPRCALSGQDYKEYVSTTMEQEMMYGEQAVQEQDVTLNLISGAVHHVSAASFPELLGMCWSFAPDDTIDLRLFSVDCTRVSPINWRQHEAVTVTFVTQEERRPWNDQQVTYEELARAVPPDRVDVTWKIIGDLSRK